MAGPLARAIRAKYPGAYDSVPDSELEAAIKAKYPGVYDDVDDEPPSAKRPEQILAESDPNYIGVDQARAGARALGNVLEHAPLILGTAGAAIGNIPGAAIGGASGALIRDLARANRGDPRTPTTGQDAATNVGLNAAGQAALVGGSELLGRGIVGGGQWLASKADPLIQSAIKPALTELRRAAGTFGTSSQAQAKRISGLVKRTGIRTPEEAEAAIKRLETRIQQSLKSVTKPTDAPQRGLRYLDELERNARKQMSPGHDPVTVGTERAMYEQTSPLFKTVEEQTTKAVPSTLVDDTGRPFMRTEIETTSRRLPRTDVSAAEAMRTARGTSKWATRKAHGELKSLSIEAQKALERAGRDSAKAAAGQTPLRADLREQGDLLRLKPILDRMMVREGSRDAMSLPGLVGAAPAVVHGKVPVLGMAAQWMRNNQLRAGIGADKIGQSLQARGLTLGDDTAMLTRALMALLTARSNDQ